MRFKIPGYVAALIIGLGTQCTSAADAVSADVIVHVTAVQPTHRLVKTTQVELAYGDTVGTFGFEPAGRDRQAVGPSAFDVDGQGHYVVADPVRHRLVRLQQRSGVLVATPLGALPLPFSDLAVDRDGWIYLTDLRSRTLTTVAPSTTSRAPLPGKGLSTRFLRQGDDVVLSAGASSRLLRRGALTQLASTISVEKCNAEAGLITMAPGGKQIQVELGGPLASIRLIGVNGAGDIFVIVERFVQRGRLAVNRHVLVIAATGALKAQLQVIGAPAIHPVREFVLGPRGALHRMVPGTQGVAFLRWEVRP